MSLCMSLNNSLEYKSPDPPHFTIDKLEMFEETLRTYVTVYFFYNGFTIKEPRFTSSHPR